MSILLESLNKEAPSQDAQVPNMHESHFDDDMLGDEWLLRRVKLWQFIAIVAIIGVAISWIGFYHHLDKVQSLSNKLETENSELKSQLNKALQTASTLAAKANLNQAPVNASQNVATASPVNTPVASEQATPAADAESVNKQQYVPKKRQPVKRPKPVAVDSGTSKETTPATVANNTSQGGAVSKEELSADLYAQFPNIEINSFVVADNPKDSFVILDGSFYKENQVIAPDLILREISKEYILVEFHTQLVKLPHN